MPQEAPSQTQEPEVKKKQSVRKALASVKTIVSLLLVSGAVYIGFYMVACDESNLSCKSVYEWDEIILAVAIILGSIIGSAAGLILLFKLIRGNRPSGFDWASTEDEKKSDRPD